jgi:hypothetical protein
VLLDGRVEASAVGLKMPIGWEDVDPWDTGCDVDC